MAANTCIHGNHAPEAAVTRQLEHDMMALTVTDPVTGHEAPVMVVTERLGGLAVGEPAACVQG